MPWTAKSAIRHTKKASTGKLSSLWSKVSNQVLSKTGNDARAIREANAVVKRVRGR